MKLLNYSFSTLLLIFLASSQANSSEARKPEKLFDTFCFSCHGTGWENAPVIGDSFAWEERIEQGIDVLLKHTVEGFNSMPPKGGCADCTSDELKALILWMSE